MSRFFTSFKRYAPGAFVVAAIALAAARFAWVQTVLVRAEGPSGGADALPFLFASLALCIGPGLFVWRAARLSTDSPALFLTHVLATSLGCSMLVPWLLLLCGLWTRGAAMALVFVAAALGIAAALSFAANGRARSSARRGISEAARSLSPSEALAIAFALFVGELLFELTAGSPMQGWDAFLSWDRWAGEFTIGHAFGRQSFGFYPPGIPLLGSVFYKILPASGPLPASTAHLLLHGFHAVFPLLLLLSVCALSRPLGFNPLVGQFLVLSDFFLVQSLLKQAGDADVPLAAFCAAALALTCHAAASRGDAPRLLPAFAAVPVFFAMLFAKGSGLAMLPVAVLALRGAAGDRRLRRDVMLALATAAALALPFYIHQCALAAFPGLAVHDPLGHLALPLETAHVNLFKPDLAHLRDWIGKAGPLLGIGGGAAASFAAAAFFTAAVLFALADRRALAAAAGSILLFAIWFFTSSYDWRNAFPAHLLACLAAAAMLRRLAGLPRRPAFRVSLEVAAVIDCFILFSRQRLVSLSGRLACRPVPPHLLSIAGESRPAAISDLGGRFRLLREVPFLRDAPRLLLSGRDYRLVPNGVRGLPYRGADTFAVQSRGDIAVARRSFFAPTRDYLPVAHLAAPRPFGETLSLFRPSAEDTPFRAIPSGPSSARLLPETDERSGFLEIRFSGPAPAGVSARAERDPAGGSSGALAEEFDAFFQPWTEKDAIRVPFWFPDVAVAPAFSIAASEPFQIVSVRILK